MYSYIINMLVCNAVLQYVGGQCCASICWWTMLCINMLVDYVVHHFVGGLCCASICWWTMLCINMLVGYVVHQLEGNDVDRYFDICCASPSFII